MSDTQLRVINRNNYTWHNVSITVNDYYSCWEQDNLNPEGIIEVQALTCDQFAINHKYIYSILVETDEGKASFTR
ncbi:hypothetical protein K9L97_03890 [Candidatus Woesearchaeota archaeon]|nr:hypothetical protein [Candidatus Woesearchaeota archaeon]